ncbi:hypothetical protein [Streptomyces sp. NPDC001415]
MPRYQRALGGLLALVAVAGGTACARSDDPSARQNPAYTTADHLGLLHRLTTPCRTAVPVR